MSREIKFRAWDKEEKEYYYNAEHTYDFFCSGRGCCAESFGEVLSQPDRFIIEQYTGLKDRNGKEIYEGDIVSVHHSDMLHDHNKFFGDNALVKCSLSKGGAFIIRNWYGERILDWDIPLRFIEVIGNINENPELFGGEE